MTEEKTAKVVENTEKNGSVCLKSRGELARELFREGYNCSQAVTLAFADELETRGISREMAAGLASSFGGGLGRLREVCGCVSGMALVCVWKAIQTRKRRRRSRITIKGFRSL